MHFHQEFSFLLLPWILSFFVSVIYECLVFVYLITNKKVTDSNLMHFYHYHYQFN